MIPALYNLYMKKKQDSSSASIKAMYNLKCHFIPWDPEVTCPNMDSLEIHPYKNVIMIHNNGSLQIVFKGKP